MPKCSLKTVTNREVTTMIDNLKNSHAFGRDTLDAATLKIAAPVISPVITHIINMSMGTCKF